MVNFALGLILYGQATKLVQGMIRNSMLSIANTASDQINGDVIGSFTEEDVGSEEYNEILDDLKAFLDNTNVEYIYTVRQVGPEKFVFTVDSDPVKPAEFGEEIVYTEALRKGGQGIAAVDDEPAPDEWGNFYSAYSPIFDSKGEVAGVVGVDFSSSWYNNQIWKNTIFAIVIGILFTTVGIVGFILLATRLRRRFDDLNRELSILSGDVEELTQEICGYLNNSEEVVSYSASEKEMEATGDEIKTLGNRIHSMHEELEQYLEYMRAQVNTDGLTGVGNTAAYNERKKELDSEIMNGKADFSLIMFDINDLKLINDRYGHAGGDRVIRAAASVIEKVYEKKNTFRIGGDEFIAIADRTYEEEVIRQTERIKELTREYNSNKPEGEPALSLSQGWAIFIPEKDSSFRDVFIRADEQMYECKDSYHSREESTRKG